MIENVFTLNRLESLNDKKQHFKTQKNYVLIYYSIFSQPVSDIKEVWVVM